MSGKRCGRRLRGRILVCAAAVLAAAAGAARAQYPHTVDAGDGLYLHQAFGRAWIHDPAAPAPAPEGGETGAETGAAREIVLPAGTMIRALERLDGGWLAAGTVESADGFELYLARGVGAGAPALLAPPPNPAADPYRSGPAPLVDGGRLAGLAWLSGAGVRETAVWTAHWNGIDWSRPELVSPVGPGSQIGLSATVLAGGDRLLVWSAYDGNDVEILWSRGREGRWSPPGPLHPPNDTHDIKPAIVRTGDGGVLAAWCRLVDRAYRVLAARFDGESWSRLDLATPVRSLHPEWLPRPDGGALLLYRTFDPAGWTLRELDAGGAALRTAAVTTETTVRPAVTLTEDAGPAFEWPAAAGAAPHRLEPGWEPEP